MIGNNTYLDRINERCVIAPLRGVYWFFDQLYCISFPKNIPSKYHPWENRLINHPYADSCNIIEKRYVPMKHQRDQIFTKRFRVTHTLGSTLWQNGQSSRLAGFQYHFLSFFVCNIKRFHFSPFTKTTVVNDSFEN